MTLPERKGQKAFELRNAGDILEKLRWELNNLFRRQRHDVIVCQYHAFNCAVTAWHVTDWLWQDLPSELRAEIELAAGVPIKCLGDFQNYVRLQCSALNLCYEISRGAKHCIVDRNPDSTISTRISDGEEYDYGNPIIVASDGQHLADQVFHEALCWFQAFIHEWNILPESPFVPMSD